MRASIGAYLAATGCYRNDFRLRFITRSKIAKSRYGGCWIAGRIPNGFEPRWEKAGSSAIEAGEAGSGCEMDASGHEGAENAKAVGHKENVWRGRRVGLNLPHFRLVSRGGAAWPQGASSALRLGRELSRTVNALDFGTSSLCASGGRAFPYLPRERRQKCTTKKPEALSLRLGLKTKSEND